MKETDISQAPIEEQLDFWKGLVEGMSKALHESQKALRLCKQEKHEMWKIIIAPTKCDSCKRDVAT